MDAIRVSTNERFRVLRTLGEGATSRVFEVENRLRRGRFALKQLRRDYVSPERVARFKDEFRVFEHISHPNLSKNYELKLQSRARDEFVRRGVKHPERFIAALLPWPT
jgi:serine/threonine protein kinase